MTTTCDNSSVMAGLDPAIPLRGALTQCPPERSHRVKPGDDAKIASPLSRSRTLTHRAAAILFALASFFTAAPPAAAANTLTRAIAKLDDAKSGSLLIKTQDGGFADANRLGIDVDLKVSGPTVRAKVTQIFRNPTQDWVEAVYVYPLPEGSAVDTLKMVIGDRIVVGDIKEREKARAIYEEARRDGRKAALTEQERSNIFTNSVANIGPGETVLVQIEYQEPVKRHGGQFSLRVPMVVGPRYNPKPIVQTVDLRTDGRGWGATVNDPVPDRNRITPPVLDPSRNPPVNPTNITVRLQAGFPLAEVKSHHHQVKIESPDETTRVIKLWQGPVPADRDFELTWTAAASSAPSVGLFRERVGQADYLLATITPPVVDDAQEKPLAREVIFVIDNSGSMGGTSMAQAKASLGYALARLKPSDRFNVIRFDDTFDVLFTSPVPADASRVARAQKFVHALEARGGTEMLPALRAALTDDNAAADHVRQVVFLTDGAIGNEQQMFDTITSMRGRSRVFMVGIGSAPNSFLMARAAELGRGTFTHIGSVEQVEERMRDLFVKLESPVVTGLTATFPDAAADMTPKMIGDLYRGEPLVLATKLDQLAGSIEIQGRIGETPWRVTLPLANAAEGAGLSKVWARRKIADAEIARTLRETTQENADKTILALALEHQLVTRLTSLVAVDKTPSRPDGEPLKVTDLPLNLPAGWDFEKVFGPRSHELTPADGHETPVKQRADATDAKDGRVQLAKADVAKTQAAILKRPVIVPSAQAQGVVLPKTATDAELKMIAGAMLLAAAMLLLTLQRRRTVTA